MRSDRINNITTRKVESRRSEDGELERDIYKADHEG